MLNTSEYIASQWPLTFRFHPQSEDTLIGLPHPYTVPCKKNSFQELYYWDTYFTSLGLAVDGHRDMVRNNCNNFLHLVERYGFIPNGSRTYYLNRSQPPFLGAMIALTHRLYPEDITWLTRAAGILEKEIEFWDSRRRDVSGLYHYGSHADEPTHEEFYRFVMAERFRGIYPETGTGSREIALEMLAEAESGWDFTPRFERQCHRCAAVDLNALLYYDFTFLGLVHEKSGAASRAAFWKARAREQQELIEHYLWNEERGGYFDYLLDEKRSSRIFSAAAGFMLWSRAAAKDRAERLRRSIIERLELEFGIATCEKNDLAHVPLQWDYPNAWPPLQQIMIAGLDCYGYREDAERLARKYVSCVDNAFAATRDLWEKYNALDGSVRVVGEYDMPSMLGWTAGCYRNCLARTKTTAASSSRPPGCTRTASGICR